MDNSEATASGTGATDLLLPGTASVVDASSGCSVVDSAAPKTAR